MITINDIVSIENFITPLAPANKAGVGLSGVCKTKNLKANHLCFIKGAGPLLEFESFLENNESFSLKETTFIIAKKFYELKKERLQMIQEENIFLTDDFDRVMCLVSKHFFDLKTAEDQFLVDGRQTGEVKIAPSARISQHVFIGEGVEIGANVHILPGCRILANVKIGDNTILYPNCVVYSDVQIGQDCIIHAGVVLGSDGFGYCVVDGQHEKIWHIGGVEIGNNVEIGPNSCVDRGTFDDTIIESGTKLDNQVHIAHNCHLKKNVIVCAQSGLAGSATIGNYTAMSGHVAIAPGVEIGDLCEVAGHSAVFENVESKSRVAGSPARPMKEWLRSIMTLRKLSKK